MTSGLRLDRDAVVNGGDAFRALGKLGGQIDGVLVGSAPAQPHHAIFIGGIHAQILVSVVWCFSATFDFTLVVMTESLTKWCDESGAAPESSANTSGARATPAASIPANIICFIMPPVQFDVAPSAVTIVRLHTDSTGTLHL